MIDRTEAMTVVDVNTGKFVGSGGNLEETVTKNNLEAAEEIVRQLRLRDIGGIIVVDFIDMVLETNRDLVLRRLVECLTRDRTKHQVAEVTSLGLVQMTRKKLGLGLLETFSETVRGVRRARRHRAPRPGHQAPSAGADRRSPRPRAVAGAAAIAAAGGQPQTVKNGVGGAGTHAITEDVRNALARVAASTVHTDSLTGEDAAAPDPARRRTRDDRGHPRHPGREGSHASDAASRRRTRSICSTRCSTPCPSRSSPARGARASRVAPAAPVPW